MSAENVCEDVIPDTFPIISCGPMPQGKLKSLMASMAFKRSTEVRKMIITLAASTDVAPHRKDRSAHPQGSLRYLANDSRHSWACMEFGRDMQQRKQGSFGGGVHGVDGSSSVRMISFLEILLIRTCCFGVLLDHMHVELSFCPQFVPSIRGMR